ncbi:MAG: DNA replication and repair protein RecF [Paraprevotella sp.]|nr:DNA replication and repair protein RecF [Paraprevotella sp.]
MILNRLSIFNYKNIASAELDFVPKLNCLVGMNGEGKTNVLDVIHFLSLAKSSTTSMDSQAIMHGQELMSIQGEYEHEDGTHETIHCGLKKGQKKVLRRGKKAYRRIADHIGLIPLIMVSPADQWLIAGGSEERRHFLDIVISQYNQTYLDALMRYNKALQQRNTLLKQEEEPDNELMALLEEEMARVGTYIYEERKRYVELFIPTFQSFYSLISQEKEQVSLTYSSHGERGDLLEVIRRDRAKDRAVGYSLHGTHRDDLQMMLGGFPIKREGSQGQNKTFLIALKLAQFDFLKQTGSHTSPLLLLDDIFDKLDATRVQQIIKLVSGDHFGQIFLTDTNREHLDHILSTTTSSYRLFQVKGGNITT